MQILRFFTLVLLLSFISVQGFARPKVGVVLSGGGAKGVAHIGALKVIEEVGIPVDYIVGTSMGSLIGGLYSIGYTTDQLDTLVMSQDWTTLLGDKVSRDNQSFEKKINSEKYVLSVPFKHPSSITSGGLIEGQNVSNLLSELTVGYHDSIDFRTLPIPFACVAENVVDGSEVVFNSGVLYSAMRSSMSIPGVFAPVNSNGMVLIDGGMVNNYPVDIAKAMGADLIIGVDVDDELIPAEKLNDVANVLFQISTIVCLSGKYPENVKNTDVYIRVNINGYSAASFSVEAIDTLVDRGLSAADMCRNQLLELKKKIGLDSNYTVKREPYVAPLLDTVEFKLKEIKLEGVDKKEEEKLLKKFAMSDSVVTINKIKEVIAFLNGTMAYSSVTYKLHKVPHENAYSLLFMLKEQKNNTFNFGLRFDTEEFVSVLLNSTFDLNTTIPTRLSLTGRLGSRSLLRADYSLRPWNGMGVNLAYMFQYNDIDINQGGRRAYNETYRYHLVELSLYNIMLRRMKVHLGVRHEVFDYNDFLAADEAFQWNQQNYEKFISYFAGIKYDSFNMRGFPSKGTAYGAEYSLYTDNGLNYGEKHSFSSVKVNWQTILPITSRLSFIPSVYGRFLLSTQTPFPYLNAIGGDVVERYTASQIPFIGVSRMELTDFSTSVFRIDFRQRMGANHYLSFIGNALYQNTYVRNMFDKDPEFGGGVSYGYNSVFGPLRATFSYSSITDKLGFYMDLGFYF